MSSKDVALMAHLMRRAGFGASRDELDGRVAAGYGATVDDLLNPGGDDGVPEDVIQRYHPELAGQMGMFGPGGSWLYRMVASTTPLREKIALFWHSVFATGYSKLTNGKVLTDQIEMFRRRGLGSFRDLLVELSRDPAMIIWLDNQENHNGAINENFGRELLELFSMGVGNYTEKDIKEASRAFTGWTIANTEYMQVRAQRDSLWPYGRIAWRYEYRPEDHDDGEKTFLGETGNFNGGDIVEIICKQPATARFISRHIYHFFVADELQVPQWPYTPPRDPEAIELLSQAYFDSNYDIRSILGVLFNSDFFRSEESWFQKVRGPAEVVAGALRVTEEFDRPYPTIRDRKVQMDVMGQTLVNPPSVEGWHQGTEWINSGTMLERANFLSAQFGDLDKPGVKELVSRIMADRGGVISPERLVDGCLDELGALRVSDATRSALVEFASKGAELTVDAAVPEEQARRRVAEVLRVVAATPEFQRG